MVQRSRMMVGKRSRMLTKAPKAIATRRARAKGPCMVQFRKVMVTVAVFWRARIRARMEMTRAEKKIRASKGTTPLAK